jgi:hypothetical protein
VEIFVLDEKRDAIFTEAVARSLKLCKVSLTGK